MLPILAAVLAFITIGGLGWVFVGGDDSSAQAVKRAQSLGEGKKNPALARKAAAANTPEARRKQILLQLQDADRRERLPVQPALLAFPRREPRKTAAQSAHGDALQEPRPHGGKRTRRADFN